MYHQQKNKDGNGRHGHQNHHKHCFSIPTTIPLCILLLASVWLLISATISATSTMMVHGMALNQQQTAAALDDDGNAANNNNNAMMMNGKSCIIRVEKVDEFKGKCTRLGDGTGKLACQTEFYLDPNNEDCARKEGEEEENEE